MMSIGDTQDDDLILADGMKIMSWDDDEDMMHMMGGKNDTEESPYGPFGCGYGPYIGGGFYLSQPPCNLEPPPEPVPDCKTNEIVIDGKCGCPPGLLPNPYKDQVPEPILNTHYVFALDRSGSMTMWGEDKWTPLIDGFRTFL